MRHLLSIVLIVSSAAFFQAGCAGAGVRPSTSVPRTGPGPDVEWPSFDLTPLVIGAVVTVAATTALLVIHARRERLRCALTPGGTGVRLIAHDEAPDGALFLADIHSGLHGRLDCVKNELRNRAAELGGNLVVLDDIQQDVREGDTVGYLGLGRAYRTEGRATDCRGSR